MAEFCLKCWNEINDKKDTVKDVVLSKEPELCEGCGEFKKIIVKPKKRSFPFNW